ncbi:hypothetical protein [Limnoglobus roseus]|uniref:Uncharacterized protein n=1 Tax=Limnoglobus roseus TaxID=2598579 RepID=A0A5C1AH18_9BACT|nr:hypothetical protein [Limnoglobus roseus]QEL18511.1 hypothetical protein PX52LOC_05537 [Limnoglobus roseus]
MSTPFSEVRPYDEIRITGRTGAGFDVTDYTGTVSGVHQDDDGWALKLWPDDDCKHPASNGKDWFEERNVTALTIVKRDS